MPELPPYLDTWAGMEDPNYTPVPDGFFDVLLPLLTDVEVRVLLYIIRRTYGFKKPTDQVSLSQIVGGITTRDGRQLDRGAGISKNGAIAAVQRLEARGVLLVERHNSGDRGHEANTYSIRKAGIPLSTPRTSLAHPMDKGSAPRGLPLAQPVDPQETGQETDSQEDRVPVSTPQEPLPYSAYIAGVLLDHARELGAAPRGSHDLATVLGWWVRSGLGEAAFVERLHAARAETRQRQAPGRDKWLLYLDALRAGLRE